LLESEQVFQINNNWTKVIGNHTIKFGGDIRYASIFATPATTTALASLNFNNGATAGTDPKTGQVSMGSGSRLFSSAMSMSFQRFPMCTEQRGESSEAARLLRSGQFA